MKLFTSFILLLYYKLAVRFCRRVFSNSIPSYNSKIIAEEMQQLNEVNESVCNEAQQIATCDG